MSCLTGGDPVSPAACQGHWGQRTVLHVVADDPVRSPESVNSEDVCGKLRGSRLGARPRLLASYSVCPHQQTTLLRLYIVQS